MGGEEPALVLAAAAAMQRWQMREGTARGVAGSGRGRRSMGAGRMPTPRYETCLGMMTMTSSWRQRGGAFFPAGTTFASPQMLPGCPGSVSLSRQRPVIQCKEVY